MCYDIKSSLKTQLLRATKVGDQKAVKEIVAKLKAIGMDDVHHSSGFEHPQLLIYTKEHPNDPVLARWGFVPEHMQNEEQQFSIWNKTLNARGEDFFDTWSYKKAARTKRCLLCVDGFFEHHHLKGKTYPYYIYTDDQQPLTLGGIWSEWVNKETGETMTTFSIVTTRGNDLMANIHNNPKLEGPRMPLILPEDAINDWLSVEVKSDAEIKRILELIKPYNEKELQAHTVQRLRGKNAVKNNPRSDQKVNYPELQTKAKDDDNFTLF